MVISFKMGSWAGAREMETTVDSNVERDLLFKRARKGVMREADSRPNHRLSTLVRRIWTHSFKVGVEDCSCCVFLKAWISNQMQEREGRLRGMKVAEILVSHQGKSFSLTWVTLLGPKDRCSLLGTSVKAMFTPQFFCSLFFQMQMGSSLLEAYEQRKLLISAIIWVGVAV